MKKYHYKISVCVLTLAFMLSGAGCGKTQASPPKKEVMKEQTQEQTRELTKEQRRKAREKELTEEQKKEGAYVDKDGWIVLPPPKWTPPPGSHVENGSVYDSRGVFLGPDPSKPIRISPDSVG